MTPGRSAAGTRGRRASPQPSTTRPKRKYITRTSVQEASIGSIASSSSGEGRAEPAKRTGKVQQKPHASPTEAAGAAKTIINQTPQTRRIKTRSQTQSASRELQARSQQQLALAVKEEPLGTAPAVSTATQPASSRILRYPGAVQNVVKAQPAHSVVSQWTSDSESPITSSDEDEPQAPPRALSVSPRPAKATKSRSPPARKGTRGRQRKTQALSPSLQQLSLAHFPSSVPTQLSHPLDLHASQAPTLWQPSAMTLAAPSSRSYENNSHGLQRSFALMQESSQTPSPATSSGATAGSPDCLHQHHAPACDNTSDSAGGICLMLETDIAHKGVHETPDERRKRVRAMSALYVGSTFVKQAMFTVEGAAELEAVTTPRDRSDAMWGLGLRRMT